MSNLIDHAERELSLLGNDEAMNQGILAMVAVFSTMGHSGSSAEYCTQVLARLLRYENLSPLTDDPDEWNHISDGMMPEGSEPTWQCRRNSEAFSHDGGKTYYLLSERFHDESGARRDEKIMHASKHVEPKPLIELSTPSPEPIHEAECSITKWGWREPCTCRPATMMQPVDIALDDEPCCQCGDSVTASIGCECEHHIMRTTCTICGEKVRYMQPGNVLVHAPRNPYVDHAATLDEQPTTRELTGQFTIGLDGWSCTIDGCTATSKDADENLIEHLRTHGVIVTEVMGVPIPPSDTSEPEHAVLVHDPQCAVSMNPGLMSAWMFCHCKPGKAE